MTSDDDHSDLRLNWSRLRSRLLGIKEHLDFGDTWQVEVSDKADRIANLSYQLDAAVLLSDRYLYAPALAVARTSLEHVVVDWLVMRGTTTVERRSNVTADEWAVWQAERATGAAWTANIIDWHRTSRGDVTIRRRGLFTEPDEHGQREQLSIYYFLLNEYDGLIGRPSDQVGDGVLTRDELRSLAEESQSLWHDYLRWSALVQRLDDSDLLGALDHGRLNAHYRFLSNFAHPVSDTQTLLYGRPLRGSAPHYDHYSSELALLYAITFAALELRNFRDGVSERDGIVVLDGGLEADLTAADEATKHFWFLGDEAHAWDTHRTANRVATQIIRGGADNVTDDDVPSGPRLDIPFPVNPLERLISQHAHARGRVDWAAYRSPWPRTDTASRT